MSIEKVLRKIVEKARWEHEAEIFRKGPVGVKGSTSFIVHALLNSEEVEIRPKPAFIVRDWVGHTCPKCNYTFDVEIKED